LEEKGHLRHEEREGRYIYLPTRPPHSAARQALDGVVRTFFKGSIGDVVAALLTDESSKLSDDELDRLQRMIEEAREEGR
jgi:predicted transcriptional regulator